MHATKILNVLSRTTIALTALTLAACASVAPKRDANNINDVVQFNMDARFAVNYIDQGEDKSMTGKMQWEDTRRATDITLSTPLGNAMAALHVTQNEARVKTSDGHLFVENTPEELTYRLLGYELPLSNVRQWIGTKGQPLPKADQGDWHVEYTKTFNDPSLAKRMVVTRLKPSPLTFTLMVDERSDAPNE